MKPKVKVRLTSPDLAVLLYCARWPRGILDPKATAIRLGLAQATVWAALTRLEQAGYLTETEATWPLAPRHRLALRLVGWLLRRIARPETSWCDSDPSSGAAMTTTVSKEATS